MSDRTTKASKPVYEVADGALKVAIWAHDGEYGPKYSVTIRRRYKDKSTDEWKDATGLNEDDLLPMRELFRDAYAWIREQRRAAAKARKDGEKAAA
jgi:hypothetical protein